MSMRANDPCPVPGCPYDVATCDEHPRRSVDPDFVFLRDLDQAERPVHEQVLALCRLCGVMLVHHDSAGDDLAAFWSHVMHPQDGHDGVPILARQVQAALALHTPDSTGRFCSRCVDGTLAVRYPCLTVRALTEVPPT